MGALDDLLGGAAKNDGVKQIFLWGVLYGFISSVFQPVSEDVQQHVWALAVDAGIHRILSPQELADMVNRNIVDPASAKDVAKASGTDPSDFRLMTEAAGEPPGLADVLQWWRRGIIAWGTGQPGEATATTAIRTGRIYDYWTDAIKAAQFTPPPVADAVNAVLRNQISLEEGIALAYFGGLGVKSLSLPGDAETADTEQAFKILLDTVGNPPSLTELLELARRKIIPWGNLDPATKKADPAEISFAQGIFEGNSKDKWLPFYAKLGVYLPPPRTIVAMLRQGALSIDLARQLLEDQGLEPSLAQAYITEASSGKVQKHRELAVSVVEELFFAQMIDQPTAAGLIGDLGYDPKEVDFILSLVDMRRSLAAINSAINRVGSYFIARKIDVTTASTMLAQLGVPDGQVKSLLQTWDIERTANVKLLAESQVRDAFKYAIMDQATAQSELEALGYTPHDAWVLLSVTAKTSLPNEPAHGIAPLS